MTKQKTQRPANKSGAKQTAAKTTTSKHPVRVPMTKDAARRIQSSADKTGTNQGFKSRSTSAAHKKK